MNRYILGFSLIFNAVLLIVLFGLIPFLLYLSVLANLFFVWFVKKSLDEASETKEDMLFILDSTESFANHLDKLHELETFYGDETLQHLINHSREIINNIVDIQEKYYDVEIGLETYDDDNEEAQTQEEASEEE